MMKILTFNFLIVFISVVGGTVGLVGGLIFKNNPPKKINWWYGYRTKRSMENQEKWDFAQKAGANNMVKYSSIPFFTSILGFVINEQHILISAVIVTLSTFSWAFFIIYKTETQLKSKFGDA